MLDFLLHLASFRQFLSVGFEIKRKLSKPLQFLPQTRCLGVSPSSGAVEKVSRNLWESRTRSHVDQTITTSYRLRSDLL